MKKLIILILVLGFFAVGWIALRQADLGPAFLRGKLDIVSRGDLTIPISGTGEIQPRARSEIKPEASGEIIEVPVKPGQLVKKGDLIIRLDPVDEDRSVRRAGNEVDRAEAMLSQQRLRLKERQTSSLAQIDARIASVDAQLKDAKFRLDKTLNLPAEVRRADEMVFAQSQYDQLVAQREGFLADRRQAEIAIEVSANDVILAQKALETAQTNLSDAEKRRSETEIRAPIDGMISRLGVEVGEVVQGGRTTITGGTVLAIVADISSIIVQTEVADADIGAVLWLAPPESRPGGKQLASDLEEANVPLIVSTTGLTERLAATGTPVEIEVDSFREEKFSGVIERIYPEPRKIQSIVTYLVDIRVTSPNWKKLALTLGMQADVMFTAQSVKNALLVPHDAIRRGPNSNLGVYVVEPGGNGQSTHPRFVPCRFGMDNGLSAELIHGEGIQEGTTVYVELPARFKPGGEDEED